MVSNRFTEVSSAALSTSELSSPFVLSNHGKSSRSVTGAYTSSIGSYADPLSNGSSKRAQAAHSECVNYENDDLVSQFPLFKVIFITMTTYRRK